MSDITDWNVRTSQVVDSKSAIELMNTRLKPPGGILVSLPFAKSKEFSAFNVIEACKEDAKRKGLEFRNVKEVDSKVSELYREIIYTAERVKEKGMSEEDWRKNQGLCKHGYRISHCIWCSAGAERVYDRAVSVFGLGGVNVMDETVKAIEEKVKTDKEEFDLTQIPFGALKRIGGIFKEGEVKYGKGNWKLGINDLAYRLERANHAIKHLYQYVAKMMEGKENEGEDDLGKVAWFCVTDMELVSLRLKEAEKNETK